MSAAETLAAGYLARPRVGIVPGFENVLSDAGTIGLMALPAQNAAIAAGLAARTLDERGLNTRQDELLEARRREFDQNREDNQSARRRELMRFAGSAFGVGGQGPLRAPNLTYVDPGSVLNAARAERAAQREGVLRTMQRSAAFTGESLQGLPALSN